MDHNGNVTPKTRSFLVDQLTNDVAKQHIDRAIAYGVSSLKEQKANISIQTFANIEMVFVRNSDKMARNHNLNIPIIDPDNL